MSILDIKDLKKEKIAYFIGTIFIMIFSFVYEIFSHNVYSNYMIFAFIYPLIGFIVFLNLKKITYLSSNLINMSIVTLTIYSIIHGVLDIYGTTNSLINIYLYLGIILSIISFISLFVRINSDKS